MSTSLKSGGRFIYVRSSRSSAMGRPNEEGSLQSITPAHGRPRPRRFRLRRSRRGPPPVPTVQVSGPRPRQSPRPPAHPRKKPFQATPTTRFIRRGLDSTSHMKNSGTRCGGGPDAQERENGTIQSHPLRRWTVRRVADIRPTSASRRNTSSPGRHRHQHQPMGIR